MRIEEKCSKFWWSRSTGGTAATEHGRSIVESSLTMENIELTGIIGDLTIANETLKKL